MSLIGLFIVESGRVGFFGHSGPVWALLGFICLVIVVAILFKLFRLILPALGVGEPWMSVIYWLAVLLLFLMFINYAFGFGWMG